MLTLHYRRKDKDAFRLYMQLSTYIPDNKTQLRLLERFNFYDLYWLMTTKIFGRYGQGSLRAEAEISKMLLVSVLFDERKIGHGEGCTALYQFGWKKLYIVMNEMARTCETLNPKCIATGHDRHVMRFAQFFNPYGKKHETTFAKVLCQIADDWILWNFNEFVGELQQCLKGKEGSKKEEFAIAVLRHLIRDYPIYSSLIMTLVREGQWNRIKRDLTN